MKPALDPRVLELFEHALDLDAARRAAFLDRACAGDPAVRAEVESLLEHHAGAEASGFLDGPAAVGVGGTAADAPACFGRYEVRGTLGAGGFGVVYKGYDHELRREVAIKVPHRRCVAADADADAYLDEARVLARLDHPGIVPVYDVGRTADGLCYLVSKFVDARDLAARLRQGRPSPSEAAAVVAGVAEALHHAHRHGLVHRDVKPANILLDGAGAPHVTDFGLALREEEFGKGPALAGTPTYMSPEQARGEGHRVDARTDVYSLGVVLYELLTGRVPFRGDGVTEILHQIATQEPRPPRQLDDAVPKELDRICLKALGKRVADRYSTARDLAEDLRHWLAERTDRLADKPPAPATAGTPLPATPTPALPADSDQQRVKVVPKGLRSFDAEDADFFLYLLPGPRDRGGLPDSVRFWKTRLEETDPDQTFRVGLLYGPSGCGKSSLVKAGLLPRLSAHVVAVYVEATAEGTEARLLKGLRKHCPDLPAGLGLVESVAALRQGRGLPAGQKVLLVLDQFEQWLHGRRREEDSELVRALRQCDGARAQAAVLVRDDFWMAATRFMHELESPLLEGQNSAAVDLFDRRHARKVLAAFGRAFGALPERTDALTREQEAFLDQAVGGLAQDGKVVPVRLAVFADRVRGKPWTPATLKEVGGTQGVGVAFLEETFSSPAANPQHRLHQKAARAVLKALLPEAGTDLKGHLRSRAELLAASGYGNRPRDFDDLIRILDGEIRLLTPTDPEGADAEGEPAASPAGARSYQLTHDYLVPSLRDWLTRQQKETRRGRAELLLADRAVVWNSRPENRQLPSPLQWLQIRWLTREKDWSAPQRRMMRQATRSHALRAAALLLGLLLLGWGIDEGYGSLRAEYLVESLITADADTADVPRLVGQLAGYRRWADPRLRRHLQDSPEQSKEHLHASLALVADDPGQVPYLYERLLHARPGELPAIRDGLAPYRGSLAEDLWAVLQERTGDPNPRLRAACALATYAPADPRWEGVSAEVAARLAAENPTVIGTWAEALKPARGSLLRPLARLLLEEGHGPTERRTLLGLCTDYAEGVPDPFAPLAEVLSEQAGAGAADEARMALARRQANAAATLAVLGLWQKVWPRFRHGSDPTARSYLIARLGPWGAEPRAVIDRLGPGREPDVSVRRALLLALAEFDRDRLPEGEWKALVPLLRALYQDDPDPGVHGAAGWLLRQGGYPARAEEIDCGLASGKVEGGRGWYVNRQGQTLVLVPAGEFDMGEAPRRRRVRIGRGFALAARDVTVAEFRRFRKDHTSYKDYAPTEDCPVNLVTWYDAAAYCNWLSQEEGIPEDQWCYVPNAQGKYAAGMKVAAGWRARSGYRLPTEAEWEYACRAGSATPRSMGAAEDLLDRYAWYWRNSEKRSHPVGSLRPNDLGLFDMHGNVAQWCQNRFARHDRGRQQVPGPADDIDDKVYDKYERPLRGGDCQSVASNVRSALRYAQAPADDSRLGGFRPARTFP